MGSHVGRARLSQGFMWNFPWDQWAGTMNPWAGTMNPWELSTHPEKFEKLYLTHFLR